MKYGFDENSENVEIQKRKRKHFWKSMMVIFSAFKDAHNDFFESKYVLNHCLKKSTIFQNFQKSNFLQVDRSHFSISFDLHMSSRPRDSFNQNDLKNKYKNQFFGGQVIDT